MQDRAYHMLRRVESIWNRKAHMTLLELINSFCLSPATTDNDLIKFLDEEIKKYPKVKKGGNNENG
jgi:hypothetical protein